MTPGQAITTTKVQDAILSYFRTYKKKHGEPPSLRYAAKELGYTQASSVHTILLVLEKKGLAERRDGKWYAVDSDNQRTEEHYERENKRLAPAKAI